MELDFSKLNNLALMDFTELPPEKQPSKTPLEPFLGAEEYKTPPKEENALEGQINGLEGIPILQRQADANKADRERALAVYREVGVRLYQAIGWYCTQRFPFGEKVSGWKGCR